jgi:hypothetical protein
MVSRDGENYSEHIEKGQALFFTSDVISAVHLNFSLKLALKDYGSAI